jgi:hypothetical protein
MHFEINLYVLRSVVAKVKIVTLCYGASFVV